MKTGLDGIGSKGSYHINKRTEEMSVSHHKDTLEYNLRHAEDHLKAAKEACEKLESINKKVEVPKSLLDLMDYFESKSDYEQAETKLKNHIKENY